MKRASYRDAVAWIAYNDGEGDYDARSVAYVQGMISTLLVADLFGVEPERVARDVVRLRSRSE